MITEEIRYGSDYEYSLYNGDSFITFNIVEVNTEINEITVAITDEGGISVCSFKLKDGEQGLYFEYGVMCEKIAIDDFEHIEEN